MQLKCDQAYYDHDELHTIWRSVAFLNVNCERNSHNVVTASYTTLFLHAFVVHITPIMLRYLFLCPDNVTQLRINSILSVAR